MPPEESAPTTTEPKSPAPAPAPSGSKAAEAATVIRDPRGRFQRVQFATTERFAEKERELESKAAPRVEGDTAEDASADDEDAETTDADTSAEGEPKARRETVDADKPAETERFTKERVAFNEWRRRGREAFEAQIRAERQRFEEEIKAERSKLDEERSQFSPRIEKGERVLKLMESGDYEALAKEAGFEDWEKFQGHVLGTVSDPNYRELREVKRKLAEREAREAKEREEREQAEKSQREQAEQRQRQEARAQAIAEHKKSLAAHMAKSPDKMVAAMADDPVFVNSVFAIQKENYDPSTRSTVTPEQAVRMALRGAPRTIREELRLLRDRLLKAELDDAPAPQAQQAPEPAKPKPPKTAVVPASATVEAAGSGRYKGPQDPAWRKRFSAAMEEAADEEERLRSTRRQSRGAR